MTISEKLKDKDSKLIRKSVLEKIEHNYDLEMYNKSIKEYKKNPKTYTLAEVKEELGLY